MINLSYLYGIGFRDYQPRQADTVAPKRLIWYGCLYERSFVVIIKILPNFIEVERLILDIENSNEVLLGLFGEVWNFDQVLSFIEKLMLLPPKFRENHRFEKNIQNEDNMNTHRL